LNLRATSSFIPLILLTLIFTAAQAVLEAHHINMPGESATLWSVFKQLLIASWVNLDRRTRHLSLPFEFDAFVFFAWPVALPYYLYKSRGARGFLLAAFIFALLFIPSIVAQLLHLLAAD
jgi:hypothetical protein